MTGRRTLCDLDEFSGFSDQCLAHFLFMLGHECFGRRSTVSFERVVLWLLVVDWAGNFHVWDCFFK